jgi:hypothetical protein
MGSSLAVRAADDRMAEHEGAAPVATLLGSISDFDQFGIQGEYYLHRGRFSLFGGAAYLVPDSQEPDVPNETVFTGGGRVFTGGFRHRGFAELSYGPQLLILEVTGDGGRHWSMDYGPNLILGYQHVANRGLTFMAAGGVGTHRWMGDRSWSFELRLGAGYTWR